MTADVAVIGAGPAGCAAAASLAARGAAVVVIDSGARRAWAGESLPPGSRQILEPVFGAAPLENPAHRIAYDNRSAWGSPELAHSNFLRNPLGHGWHVDREIFDNDLRAIAAARGARLEQGRRIESCSRNGDGWQLALAGRDRIDCRFVVDATGRNSWLTRRQGVGRLALDRQVAVIGTIPDADDGDATTLVESSPDGWWYTSPLPGSRRVAASLTDADLLPAAPLRIEEWTRALRRTRHVSQRIRSLPPALTGSAAGTSHLETLTGDGWLAVGDAAVAWDPLSSQGIVTAILMGGRAAPAILARLEGRGTAKLQEWENDYRELLRQHCEERSRFAGIEDRWPDAPFWKRRRSAPRS